MKLSLNWLSTFLDLESYPVESLSDLLTFAGIEVEGVDTRGVPSDLIVVAKVVDKQPHPDADKLNVCTVDVGESDCLQIVCGAKNYAIGDLVPCALPGADLGEGFVIKKGVLRGVASNGMLCGAPEIGLVDEEDGLMILPADYKLGDRLKDLYPSDTVLEVEITPNRPDCLSHYGMGRELGAIIGQNVQALALSEFEVPACETGVTIKAEDRCHYFTITHLKEVKVRSSPSWLKERLESIGLGPVNNVVDITNYILHHIGQPLHAYDKERVGTAITVQNAEDGQSFMGLDEQTYTLSSADLIVVDENDAVLSLAGIMGGSGSQVSDATTEILLEVAAFAPEGIRASARRQKNLITDSSYRFERGVDDGLIQQARMLAIQLFQDLAEATVVGGRACGTLQSLSQRAVALPESVLSQVTANGISGEKATAFLSQLGLEKCEEGWLVPPFRRDLTRPIDLVEEVVRLAGFDSIVARHSSYVALPTSSDREYDKQMALKSHLVGLGVYEVNSLNLISQKDAEQALPLKPLLAGDWIAVSSPLNLDYAVLRPSLTSGLLASAARNARQGVKQLRFYEIGKVFRNAGGGKARDLESTHIGILVSGERLSASWKGGAEYCDSFDLKAIVENLVPNQKVEFKAKEQQGYLLGATIVLNGKPVGVFAQLHPRRQRELGLSHAAYLVELDVKKLLSENGKSFQVSELSKYPGSSRDIALECPLDLTSGAIVEFLEKQKAPLLEKCYCFDVFHDESGERLSNDKKSLAFRLNYRSPVKSLKAKEIDAAHSVLLAALLKKFPLTQR